YIYIYITTWKYGHIPVCISFQHVHGFNFGIHTQRDEDALGYVSASELNVCALRTCRSAERAVRAQRVARRLRRVLSLNLRRQTFHVSSIRQRAQYAQLGVVPSRPASFASADSSGSRARNGLCLCARKRPRRLSLCAFEEALLKR
ncbi:hypothetical protein TGDOM2_397590, partial [Toxoplasma gondii GAB2-2007-GAL-DOM2]